MMQANITVMQNLFDFVSVESGFKNGKSQNTSLQPDIFGSGEENFLATLCSFAEKQSLNYQNVISLLDVWNADISENKSMLGNFKAFIEQNIFSNQKELELIGQINGDPVNSERNNAEIKATLNQKSESNFLCDIGVEFVKAERKHFKKSELLKLEVTDDSIQNKIVQRSDRCKSIGLHKGIGVENVDIDKNQPNLKSGEANRLSAAISPHEPDSAKSNKIEQTPTHESEQQTGEENRMKTTDILKSVDLTKNRNIDSEFEADLRISKTINKEINTPKKESNHLPEGKSINSEKGEIERFVNQSAKEAPTVNINTNSWHKYISAKGSVQNPQMPEEDITISQLVRSESKTGEEANLSSNHQPAEKMPGAVFQTKDIQHFEKSFQPAVMKQVLDNAISSLKNGRSSIKINLKPEVLGRLQMQISTENNQVAIRILTEVPMVKDILENSLNQLKADFQNQGLEIEKFHVSVNHGSSQNEESTARLPFQEKTGDDSGEDCNSEEVHQKAHHTNHHEDSSLINFFA